MLKYHLGDMKSENGAALKYEVDAGALKYTLRIADMIISTSVYKQLIKKLPSKRVFIYFQFKIKKEIYPFVRQAYVIQWYKKNGKMISFKESAVTVPRSGVLPLLKLIWDFEDVPIKFAKPFRFDKDYFIASCRWIKKSMERGISKIMDCFIGTNRNYGSPLPAEMRSIIACYYAEGFDYTRRNDLNWYQGSGIEPRRVLIYFDSVSNSTRKPIEKGIITQLENEGFRWVALKKRIIEDQRSNYWQAPKLPRNLFIKKKMAQNSVEKWILEVGNDLLEQAYYWRSFFDNFNIKINYMSEEWTAKNFAQAIAFDIGGENDGILVGKQRSEIYSYHTRDVGIHLKHIFFIWNKRPKYHLTPNYDQIDMFIISGYPYNIFRQRNNFIFSQMLRSKGVDFIISLFDNAYDPDLPFSREEMTKFYQSLLQWVLDDPKVGLIIKSKKAKVINNLTFIQPLLKKAMETGRCIRLENESGRLPTDASLGADIAIGCGISSAVMEAVIAGCRGIHYDMTHIRNHEFYKWKYERIVFDDLERLISVLKKYKEDPSTNPHLGDWSDHMDELDPFRDGRGGERIGIYMRWLLEAFDDGKNRDESIQYANKLYAQQWGEDKVIDMRQENEAD